MSNPIMRWGRALALVCQREATQRGTAFAVKMQALLHGGMPYRKRILEVYSRGGGVGDELMCTAVFRAVREENPKCQIRFHTRYPELFADHKDVDVVEKLNAGTPPPRRLVELRYDRIIPPQRRLAQLMGECAGLRETKPQLHLRQFELTENLKSCLAGRPRPWILVQPRASKWTPNKHWPLERWAELSIQLSKHATVIETGTEAVLPGNLAEHGVLSLAGRTSLTEVAALFAASDLFIGPSSSGMHFANALGVPSVILFGGYEHPDGYCYKNVLPLGAQVPCAPCWLTTPCPVGLKCQHDIKVSMVLEAVRAQLRKVEPEIGYKTPC